MALLVYNTLSRSKEEFRPRNGMHVDMFVCGLTPYDDAHLGHAKTFIGFAIVVRWLRRLGYEVKYVQNITDIEDKIIARAAEKKVGPFDLEAGYEKRFFEDMDALGIKADVDIYPKSHDYIEAIRVQIQLLMDRGYAYELQGDIYFDVAKFPSYTKLSGVKLDELERHRIEPKEGKRNSYDFALWKASKEGEPSWDVKFSIAGRELKMPGRPGWHIEDTAMTHDLFGPQYDIHGGANELIFTHHSNEIAQAEAAYGISPFVRYWMHSGVLNVNDSKMSKSLKNFITIREALKLFDPEVLKLFVASTHYRKEVNYTDALMKEARQRLNYMYAAFGIFYNMNEAHSAKGDAEITAAAGSLEKDFSDAMNDDFNTPLALSKLVISINKLRAFAEANTEVGAAAKKRMVDAILGLASVFGILGHETYKQKLPEQAHALILEREMLRKQKRFDESDSIRDRIQNEYGLMLEDTEYGTVWYKEGV